MTEWIFYIYVAIQGMHVIFDRGSWVGGDVKERDVTVWSYGYKRNIYM